MALMGGLLGGLVVALAASVTGLVIFGQIQDAWTLNWYCAMLCCVVIPPAVVVAMFELFDGGWATFKRPWPVALRNLGVLLAMVLICAVVFRSHLTDCVVALPIIPFGVLTFAAFAIGPRTAAGASLIMAVEIVGFTGKGMGPFASVLGMVPIRSSPAICSSSFHP